MLRCRFSVDRLGRVAPSVASISIPALQLSPVSDVVVRLRHLLRHCALPVASESAVSAPWSPAVDAVSRFVAVDATPSPSIRPKSAFQTASATKNKNELLNQLFWEAALKATEN